MPAAQHIHVTWQAWVYLVLFVAWGITEFIAIKQKDTLDKPRTLSAVIRWIVQPAGQWHLHARYLFIAFMIWFKPHILGG